MTTYTGPLSDGDSVPMVAIYSRVVAAGTSIRDSHANCRMTLLLTPVPHRFCGAIDGTIPLSAWPKGVVDAFRQQPRFESGKPEPSITIEITKAIGINGTIATPGDKNADGTLSSVTARVNRLWWVYGDAEGQKDLEIVGQLWRDTFDQPSEAMHRGSLTPWEALAASLSSSLSGSANPAGGVSDKSKARKESINDVRSIRQGDIAVGIELMRAHEVAATVKAAFGDAKARRALEERIRRVDRKDEAAPTPWQGAKEDPLYPRDDQQRLNAINYARDTERDRVRVRLGRDSVSRTPAAKFFDATQAEFDTSKARGVAPLSSTNKPAALAAQNAEELHQALDAPLASHLDGTTHQPIGQGATPNPSFISADPKDRQTIERTSQRYFAVQSTPSLARLFCLAIDIEVEPEEFEYFGNDTFLFIGTRFGCPDPAGWCEAGLPAVWTLAKLQRQDSGVHFWPATRGELALAAAAVRQENGAAAALTEVGKYTQLRGMMALGQGYNDGDPRFEITSLDVRSAAEGQEQRNRERRQLPTQFDGQPDGGPSSQQNAQLQRKIDEMQGRPEVRQTLRTAGLTLIDRGHEAVAAGKLALREAQLSRLKPGGTVAAYVLLDADELTVGYRPDVAVHTKDGFVWRSLMNREIVFGASGESGETVRKLLSCLSGHVGSPERTMFDSALLSAPMRLMPDGEGSTTIVEEILAIWDGGPMAMECGGPDSIKKLPDDLPIGREIKLPASEDKAKLRPPNLRFGWPYRIGMRAVFVGGASPTLDEAQTAYDQELDGGLAFPPGRSERPQILQRRFLRQERIDAPTLLLPGDLARKGHKLMGFERSPHAIVRTYQEPGEYDTPSESDEGEAAKREYPLSTRRVFVVPSVAQAFATLHGHFDGDRNKPKSKAAQPPQGLPGVRYDADKGGFPFAVPTSQVGLDSVLFVDKRTVETKSDQSGGDGVFETHPDGGANRPVPYYPDPAARYFVLGLRCFGTTTYLGGPPIAVPIYANELVPDYPNALPLEVSIVSIPKKRESVSVTHGDVIHPIEDLVELDPTHSGRKVKGRRVEIQLYAGENFELDVWCAMDGKTLARTFSVIEALGIVAAQAGDAPKMVSKLTELFGDVAIGTVPAISSLPIAGPGYSGLGGLPTPSVAGLLAIANIIANAQKLRPIDELGSITTLHVTHAVNRPLYAPRFWSSLPPTISSPFANPPRIARLDKEHTASLGTKAAETRFSSYFVDDRIMAGSSEVAIGGSLLLDLDTTDAFEIEALTVFPRSTVFDDPKRGRSRRDRRAGRWPEWRDPADGQQKLSSTLDVYGFHVDPDGRVELPRSAVTMMRVDHLKDSQQVANIPRIGALELLNLEEFYGIQDGDGQSYPGGVLQPTRVQGSKLALPHAFPDGKARKLTLTILALSRFAHSWQTAPRRDSDFTFRGGDELPKTAEVARSMPIDIWLPATARPAKPATRSPLPCFRWKFANPEIDGNTTVYSVERVAVVRIPLLRDWFSSGEGERLGIVVWPPQLFDLDADLLAQDLLNTPYRPGTTVDPVTTRLAKVFDFEDGDLGPGGAYVTRWGGDPIRDGGIQGSMLMPSNAFADFDAGDSLTDGPRQVRSVPMPVNVPDFYAPNAKDDPSATGTKTELTMLEVTLLTYLPRFDVGREEWYVDVDIAPAAAPDPFVRLGLVRYQEHAPRELRVSQPVVEWTQLLPRRRMAVRVTDHGDLAFEADVAGQAATGTAPTPANNPSLEAPNGRPVMVFSLCFEARDSEGRKTCEILETITAAATTVPRVLRATRDGETFWSCAFESIRQPLRRRLGTGTFFLYAEEVERRHPASYETEPLTLKQVRDDNTFIPSGPRFAARLDLAEALMPADSKLSAETVK